MFCSNLIVRDEDEKVELYCKGEMKTILHHMTYKINVQRYLEQYQNYHKFKTHFGAYTIIFLLLKYKNLIFFDIKII